MPACRHRDLGSFKLSNTRMGCLLTTSQSLYTTKGGTLLVQYRTGGGIGEWKVVKQKGEQRGEDEGDRRDLKFMSALHKACMGFRKALAASGSWFSQSVRQFPSPSLIQAGTHTHDAPIH